MRNIYELIKEDAVLLDKALIISVLFLSITGIICVYSAGSGFAGRGFELAIKQTAWVSISLIAMLVTILIGHRKLLEGAYAIFILTIVLLIITDLIAPRVKGAHSWIGIGGFRFQPSEFTKISIILMFSRFFGRNHPNDIKIFITGLFIMLIPVILVLIQPDAGSALVYLVISFGMLIASGTPFKYLLSLVLMGLVSLPFLIFFVLKDYQINRILVFIDPMRDPLGAGYNVIQSRIAVGSGGFWGKGFMLGTQSKLRFLPEPHTDFIFSVLSEEFGFLGTIILIIVFLILLSRIIKTGLRTRDIKCKILTGGAISWIWFQLFESIGMSIGMTPVTGLPLPFLSYGGSSLLSSFIIMGIVISISIEKEREERARRVF